MKRLIILTIIILLTSINPSFASAKEFFIVIKNHEFTPSTITVPAGKKIKLIVENKDATPEEFESDDLHKEKLIKGNTKAIINIGPLKEGEYKFHGEFNEETAKGVIKAE